MTAMSNELKTGQTVTDDFFCDGIVKEEEGKAYSPWLGKADRLDAIEKMVISIYIYISGTPV